MALFEHDERNVERPAVGGDDEEVTPEIDVLIGAIEAVSEARNYAPRPLWPEPLPAALDWIDLGTRILSAGETGHAAELAEAGLAIGLADLPDLQAQLPWRWDPDSGPLVMYGSSAECAGKALVSIGAAFAEAGNPGDVHLYLIDGDAGNIAPLTGLAHTGAYVTMSDRDRVERTLGFFERELASRRTEGDTDTLPRLVLMIDNLAAVLGAYDDMGAAAFVDRLGAVARDGSPQRIHVVLTARTVRDVSHRLSQQIPNRLVLALADPSGFLTLGLKQREVVPLPDMRAMDLSTKRTVQLVEPPDLVEQLSDYDIEPSRLPRPIRTFPVALGTDELERASVDSDGRLLVPVGIEAADLGSATLVLQPGEHALVVSAAGGGRSTALLTILDQLATAELGLELFRVAPLGSPLCNDGLPGAFVSNAEELSALGDRAGVLLVDDAGRLDDEMSSALETLTSLTGSPLRVVAAATTDHARAMRSNVSKVEPAEPASCLAVRPPMATCSRSS